MQFKSSWDLVVKKLSGWVDSLIVNLPNIVIAIAIFFATYWLSNLGQTWIRKLLKNRIHQKSIRNLLGKVFSILIIILGTILALSVLNLDDALSALLAGAGVAGLAISLALQGTLSNTLSGFYLAVNDVLGIGDWVETNGFSGEIVKIDLRNTQLKEPDNNIVVIPNKSIIENPFKNFGLTKRIRASITCGVSYDSDLKVVKETAKSAISELFPPPEGKEIEFYYQEFGSSSIDFLLRFWVDATRNLTALQVKSEAIMALKSAFDEQAIEIPFPIRSLIQQTPSAE